MRGQETVLVLQALLGEARGGVSCWPNWQSRYIEQTLKVALTQANFSPGPVQSLIELICSLVLARHEFFQEATTLSVQGLQKKVAKCFAQEMLRKEMPEVAIFFTFASSRDGQH